MNTRSLLTLPSLVVASAVLTIGISLWIAQSASTPQSARPTRTPWPAVPVDQIPIDGAALLGVRTAKIAIIEFGDFLCEHCAKFARESLPALKARYMDSGQALYGLIQIPGKVSGPFSTVLLETAECARSQETFWNFHGLLFAPRQLDEVYLRRAAMEARLSMAELDSCLARHDRTTVAANTALAYNLNVASTPTFFVGTLSSGAVVPLRRLTGSSSEGALEEAIRGLLGSTTTSDISYPK